MTMSERTYTKIDEFTFKCEEDRHLEQNFKIDEQFNYLANCLNQLRDCVKQANGFQERFVKIVETYNRYVDMMTEAKEKCGYSYKLPAKIELPECFDIIEVKPENIPTVDFKIDDKK